MLQGPDQPNLFNWMRYTHFTTGQGWIKPAHFSGHWDGSRPEHLPGKINTSSLDKFRFRPGPWTPENMRRMHVIHRHITAQNILENKYKKTSYALSGLRHNHSWLSTLTCLYGSKLVNKSWPPFPCLSDGLTVSKSLVYSTFVFLDKTLKVRNYTVIKLYRQVC